MMISMVLPYDDIFGVLQAEPGVGAEPGDDQQLRLLIREFVDIHNVITNLMRATYYLGCFADQGF